MGASNEKKAVGEFASSIVKDGQVLGMGTGSTVAFFAAALGDRTKSGEEFFAVPTSYQSIGLCLKNNIRITSLNEHRPELAFDGADEVDPRNNLIKGRGGAMTQEKIIDYYSNEFFVLVDKSKMVGVLGEAFPVPIEIIPMSVKPVMERLTEFGQPTLREAKQKDGPVVTDNGNFIVDLKTKVEKPSTMEEIINNIPGVVENGIFTRNCKIIYPVNDDVINIR